ncbi:MAG: deoxyguanosinetriphosphate triphosphohydrolase family protein [Candidatus Bipolaricaulota bacterium]
MRNSLPERVYKERKRPRKEDVRGAYFRDQTAIIHCLAFRRLKNKTQVFFAPENDHICTRVEHVLHVSTIAATVCKGLGLDVELAQAISLGHDLGHAPFGHSGEKILSDLTPDDDEFIHELHSLRTVDKLARHGKGLNLTYAVRDGIVSHYGEEFSQYVEPHREKKDLYRIDVRGTYPSSLEGCVVRMSDKIAYLGRDIEDAIKAGLIANSDIPGDIQDQLGKKNGEIIDAFVTDLIEWSRDNDKIGFSAEKYRLMKKLKDFNYSKIYEHQRLKRYVRHCRRILKILFNHLLELFEKWEDHYQQYLSSDIPLDRRFGDYLAGMDEFYGVEEPFNARQVVLDYLAGMTDQYALKCVQEVILPEPIEFEA